MGFEDDAASRRALVRLWCVLAVALAVACAVALAGALALRGQPALWLVPPLAFAWLSLTWRGSVPRPDLALLATGAAIVVLAVVGFLVSGESPAASLRAGVGVAVQAALLCGLYRGARSHLAPGPPPDPDERLSRREAWRHEWVPTDVRDLALLAVAAVLATVLVLPIGAYPQLWVGDATTLALLRWTAQTAVSCFVAGACVLLLLAAPPAGARDGRGVVPLLQVVLLVAASAGCAWLVLEVGDRPLAWILLLPSLYAGVVLPPWATALHSLGLLVSAALVGTLPRFDAGLPTEVAVDLLAGVAAFVALALSLLSTARRQALALLDAQRGELAEQADLFNVVFNAMSDGLLLINDRGGISLYNAAAKTLLGKPVPKSRLSNWGEYFGLRRLDGGPVHDVPGSPGHENGEATVVVNTPSSTRVLHASARSVETAGGVSVVLFSDKTVEQQRLSELRGFAGTVAHDLRAPLTGLEGWLELAREALEDGDVEEAVRMLARTQTGASRMRQVVQDWLDYAVGRDGTLALADVDLHDTATEVVSTFVGSGYDPEPEFVINAPHVVQADPAMARQVLANLINNAVKYAVPGVPAQVRITSRVDVADGWVRVDVSDSGQGIPPGEEHRIFEEFHRADSHRGTVAGTGLGLALCRRIITRHGGVIAAHNNPEGGATVTFTLPAAAAPTGPPAVRADPADGRAQ